MLGSMDLFNLLQWPAFVASLGPAYLVGSNAKGRRNGGFWVFLLSNVLWATWGVAIDAGCLELCP